MTKLKAEIENWMRSIQEKMKDHDSMTPAQFDSLNIEFNTLNKVLTKIEKLSEHEQLT